jgi:RNA polymerase sigma-70 factor, ECF subfamily
MFARLDTPIKRNRPVSGKGDGQILWQMGKHRYNPPVPPKRLNIHGEKAMTIASPEVTQLLVEWGNGDQTALDKLLPLVNAELRQLAKRYMRRESPGHTLQTSALVNEAYLRLVDQKHVQWQNRAHFLGVAAQLMRRILIDHARSHQYAKRGGGAVQVSLDETAAVTEAKAAELLAVDEALEKLAVMDARKGRIIELRFYGGMTEEETAEVLGISVPTIQREWRAAKVWLYRLLAEGKVK